MPEWLIFILNVALETTTLFVLLVGLMGLIVPVFPGLTVMWLATLVYALIQSSRGLMTGWDWLAFAIITTLMIGGNIIDNIIIASKMRDQYIPWSSILLAFGFGAWLVNAYFQGGGWTNLAGGAASGLAGIGLMVYGRIFQKGCPTINSPGCG